MVKFKPTQFVKSFYYDQPLLSSTFAGNVTQSLGQGFKLKGFNLLEVKQDDLDSPSSEPYYKITLGPGSFVSKGVAVEIKGDTVLHIPNTFEDGENAPVGISIFGYTESIAQSSGTHIEFKNTLGVETDPNLSEAFLGLFYPETTVSNTFFTADGTTEGVKWRWLPAPEGQVSSFSSPNKSLHAWTDEVARQWDPSSWSSTTTSDLDFSIRDTTVSMDWGFRVDLGTPNYHPESSMVFSNGRLLREGADYLHQGPGSLIVWNKNTAEGLFGGVTYSPNPYFSTHSGIVGDDFDSGSICVLSSENIKFRYDISFDGDNSSTVDLPAHLDLSDNLLVFTDGFLLSPDRYTLEDRKLNILPREASAGGFYWVDDSRFEDGVSTLASFSAIRHLTVIGSDSLAGVHSLINEKSGVDYFPDNGADPDYYSVPTIGETHLWANGRLCYPNFDEMSNSTASFEMSKDGADGVENHRQLYANQTGPNMFEISNEPPDVVRDSDYATYYGHGSEVFTSGSINTLVATVFSSANVGHGRKSVLIRAKSYEELTDVGTSSGAAIFNTPYNGFSGGFPVGHVSENSSPRPDNEDEFWSGTQFNSNYFVTLDYLCGFITDPDYIGYIMPGYENQDRIPVKELSLLGTRLTVDLMSDVPTNTGPALSAATSIVPGGEFYEEPTVNPGNGTLVNSTTGIYTKDNDIDEFFSDLNPVVNYASLDSFLSKFSESFGTYLENGDGTRDILRDAGIEYDVNGVIQKAFGSLLNPRTKNSFDIGNSDTLVQVMEKMGGLNFAAIGYGWGMGYMWTNSWFNMETGDFESREWNGKQILKDNEHGWYQNGQSRKDMGANLKVGSNSQPGNPLYYFCKYSNDFYHSDRYNSIIQGTGNGQMNKGMYYGHVGFLSPKSPPNGVEVGDFWQSDQWSSTANYPAANKVHGTILLPPNDLTDKCYPKKVTAAEGPPERDGINDAYNTNDGTAQFPVWVGYGQRVGKNRKLHYKLGDRTYLSKKSAVHNIFVHVAPTMQLYAHDDEISDFNTSGFGDKQEKYWSMVYRADNRRFAHYLDYNDDGQIGLRVFGHTHTDRMKNYESYVYSYIDSYGGGGSSVGNYRAISNIPVSFFIFGPTASPLPKYAGSDSITENFYIKQ